MERWQRIDASSRDEARELLQACCGAARWIERMMAVRPFGSAENALRAAREAWFSLTPDDWREAFSHHPRIGDIEALRKEYAPTRTLSEREQSGATAAPDEVRQALASANRAYENRFGYIFIVCATGRTAEQMLAILRSRLANDPEVEIRIAAEEHARICELRLRSHPL
jgi:2-oxo-4-hydroxy-4-carboxy-5-ureidoimidazoline decarboxylase